MKKTITYERVVLTLIAGLLFLNFVKDKSCDNHSESSNSIARFASMHSLESRYAVVPINEDGSIDVRIKSSLNTIDVNIESSDPYSLTYAGPIDVKIKN